MAKYASVIQNAKQGTNQETSEPESKLSGNAENQKTIVPAVKDEEVNLSIKISKRRRQHWAAEAKRQGTTITAVVADALSTRFGEPEG